MKYEFSASQLPTAALADTTNSQNKTLHTGDQHQWQDASAELLQWSLNRGSLRAQCKAYVCFREAVQQLDFSRISATTNAEGPGTNQEIKCDFKIRGNDSTITSTMECMIKSKVTRTFRVYSKMEQPSFLHCWLFQNECPFCHFFKRMIHYLLKKNQNKTLLLYRGSFFFF